MAVRGSAVVAVCAAVSLLGAAEIAAARPVARATLDTDGAVAYWTPKRMADARPLPPPLGPRDGPGRPGAREPRGPVGRPGSLPPSPPRGAAGAAVRVSSGEVRAQRRFPQRANGRLFFTQGRKRYTCSAVVVQSRSDAVVLTAGHCVLWRGRWSRRVIFVPAYRRGERPFGLFRGAAEAVPRGWWAGHGLNYDYGAVKLRRGSRGRRVGDVTGEVGVSWSYPRRQLYRVVGYPQNLGGGERMWECASGLRRRDGGRSPGPASIGVACPMRKGSSGGGWTYDRAPGDGPYLASVTSHYYPRDPGLLFGPYFDRRLPQLIRFASRR